MLKGYQHYLLSLFLLTLISCEFSSSNTTNTDIDPGSSAEVATSEAVPDVVRPIVLVDPVGDAGVVESNEVEVSGHILTTSTDITTFTATLNNNTTNDILSSLAADGRFVVPIENLNEGTNTLTLNVTDNLAATTSLDLTITYTKPEETPEPSEPEDDTTTPEPDVDLMSLILDILNTTQSRYQDFATLLDIFADNEAALSSIFDFLSTWDGSDAALQEWWNEWANAGTRQISFPGLRQQDSQTQTDDNSWQLDDVRISLNDIAHVTQVLFPQLVDELKDIKNSDDFVVLENQKDVLWCDFVWSVKITSVTSTLGLSADNITNIHFLDNKQVSISLDLDKAEMDSTFKLIANPPKACVFNDSSRGGEVHAKKLSGTLVLQLDYDAEAKTLMVKDIISSTLKVSSVTSSMDEADGFWASITEWIFKRLHGCNFCSSEDAEKALFQYLFDIEDEDPYKTMFNTALQKDDHIQNMLLEEFNKIFTQALQFDGTINTEENSESFAYNTAMTQFSTDANRNQLISNWTLAVAAAEPRDSCAKLFKIPESESTRSNMAKIGNIGVQLTYSQIATMLKGIARTGAFCFSQDITFDDFTLAELDLRPYGTIAIADSKNQGSHLDVTYPFEIDVNWGNADNSNAQILSLKEFTGSSTNNKIYGSVVLSVHLATDCEAGLTLSVDQIELVTLDGTLKINAYTFDLDIIRDELTDWLNNISLTSLQNIPLTSQLLDLEGLENISIEMEETFIATDTDLNLGLTLVENSACQ